MNNSREHPHAPRFETASTPNQPRVLENPPALRSRRHAPSALDPQPSTGFSPDQSARPPGAVDLAGLDRAGLEALLAPLGGGRGVAANVMASLYRDRPGSIADLRGVRRAILASLARVARIGTLTPVRELAAAEDAEPARKYILAAEDGLEIETVSIPARDRQTICVSSQIGCRMGCSFCQTARMGLVRNLTAAEIVHQVLFARDRLPPGRAITNIVFMGMGEPTDNLDAVWRSIEVMTDQRGLAIPRSRVTVSSVGYLPGLEKLAARGMRINLALSLNASDDAVRSEIMPVNRAWPIEALLAFADRYPLRPGKDVCFEYVLLAGVNDGDADADRLAALLGPRRAKVNVIAYNPVPGLPHARPPAGRIESFAARLASRGVWTSIRASRGQDVMGACGQLGRVAAGTPA